MCPINFRWEEMYTPMPTTLPRSRSPHNVLHSPSYYSRQQISEHLASLVCVWLCVWLRVVCGMCVCTCTHTHMYVLCGVCVYMYVCMHELHVHVVHWYMCMYMCTLKVLGHALHMRTKYITSCTRPPVWRHLRVNRSSERGLCLLIA